MICLIDNLPLVAHGNAYTTTFQREWMRNALISAAAHAGYESWWLADHVTASVTRFLATEFDGTVVSTALLDKTVRSVLQGIGYPEVAVHFAPYPPPVLVPLGELADRADTGYELVFFDLLDAELDRLITAGVGHIRFSGLHYSVKAIQDAKRWRKGCRELQDDIVAFIRTRLHGRSVDREVTFTLS